ncbi:MAG TPA: DNA primase, partial [Verrucomicrobiae bacterium]|nr:DNA primase [Verrucomicrobiae bacterium]
MAGFFSPELIERIRAASDVVDVIGSYLPLKRAGANWVALCPFHKEKSPSFNVNPHKQIFYCFGCHKGGDVFTFVKEYENIDFVEAVKRLADRAKIPLDYEQGGPGAEIKHLKDTLLQIHEQITQRWHHCLLNEAAGQVARDYLAKRGVSEEAIKLFRLGAAPEAWDDTVNWAKSKGHELEMVEKAGLIILKGEGGTPNSELRTPNSEHRRYYDRFRGRLMFPICDEQGRVIGFSGRVLSGDEKTAKYVNSPETPIFKKSKVLFALDKAKRTILDVGYVVICEGQLDTISCHSKGIVNVVAPQGTALTAEHVQILKRYTDDIILCFDGDNAGRKAAARGFNDLISLGIPFRVAEVPAPEDPDSFIKRFGFRALLGLLENARDFFEWYLTYLSGLHDVKTDRGKLAVIRGMAEVLYHPNNTVIIDTYIQRTAHRLEVAVDAVRTEFKKISKGVKSSDNQPLEESTEPTAETERPSRTEFWLLKLIFLDEDLIGFCAENLEPDWIPNQLVRQVFLRLVEVHRQGTWSNLGAFLTECETQEMRNLVTEAATGDRAIPNPQQQLVDTVLYLRNQFIAHQLAILDQ